MYGKARIKFLDFNEHPEHSSSSKKFGSNRLWVYTYQVFSWKLTNFDH